MSFQNIWPVFLLILIPVIIILYLLKQKAVEQKFPSLILWHEAYKNIEAKTPWEKLKNNLLMILQILTVLILIAALASPYIINGGTSEDKVILAVDVSGSMQITDDQGKTRFDTAISEASKYVDSVKDGTEITILTYDSETTIACANLSDKNEAKRVLKGLAVTDLADNFTTALNMVESLGAQWGAYQAVFFTDSVSSVENESISFCNVFTDGVNACITSVSTTLKEDGATVLVQVSNPSPYGFSTDINLYLDETLVDIQEVSLEAGETKNLLFEQIPVDGIYIKAEINSKDALLKDNTGYALLSGDDVKTILLVTEENVFLEKAIMASSPAELYKTNSTDNIDGSEGFDLYIFDRMYPETLPETGNFIFIKPSGTMEGLFQIEESYENIMVLMAENEVTQYLNGYSFGVTKTDGYKKPAWAANFLTVGEQSAGYIGTYEGRTIAVLGFDIHHSDFPLQTEFPIFVRGLLDACLKNGIINQYTYQTGEQVELSIKPDGGDITVQKPNGETESITATSTLKSYDGLELAGLYSFEQDDTEEAGTIITVAFPTGSESVITSEENAEGILPGQQLLESRSGRDIRNWVIILALLLLLAEWIVYIRQSG